MISIVVPTYNEKDNLDELFKRIADLFVSDKVYEIIVVDDNSSDGTWELLERLRKNYPLKIFKKEGRRGKSFSLIEGFEQSCGERLVMIDADLQYPPEAIPQMVAALKDADFVVANRKTYNDSSARKLLSRTFRFAFGKFLFGIDSDIQSGLKVFKRRVWKTVKFAPKSPWTFDLEFLHRAREAGFTMKNLDIDFNSRTNGNSKINILRTTFEIGTHALILKTKKIHPYSISPHTPGSMQGAGVGWKKRQYITHTTLPHGESALKGFALWQKLAITLIVAALASSFYFRPLEAAITLIAALSIVYFADVIFNLFLIIKSLHNPPEINVSEKEIASLKDQDLPIYSVLCPLYKEAHILPHFLEALDNLDWPKDKFDVLLLLEEDDYETKEAIQKLSLPSYVRSIVVPVSMPKTKPKACNYGLSLAIGQYLVIYDAEDIPEVDQLKKAYLAFEKTSPNVICLQAKLNYYNPHQNLITRFFTAEYSLWFDVILPALQSIQTIIPLGGTSNHFKIKSLKRLQGWDPFNVTEDADLGVRIFKNGYQTAVFNSTTLEEANSRPINWLRQRSRWIKGYMQTYLVHMRNPVKFVKTNGIHAFIFQLVVGGKIASLFINPLLWVATISYFAFNSITGPTIEALYPAPIFYIAVISLIFGNFLYLYYYMIGCAKRGHWPLVKYVFLVPFYWLAISFASVIALYQLIVKPHYWEKTVHGFHHAKIKSDLAKVAQNQIKVEIKAQKAQNRQRRFAAAYALARTGIATGGVLIAASIFGNFANFAYNAYLGRSISVEDFGLISLVGSFFYLSTIPLGALGKTVTHRAAFLLGKYETPLKTFWSHVRLRAIIAGTLATVIWLALTPLLAILFKSPSYVPFLLFAPVWFIGATAAVDSGFLSGNLKFKALALLIFIESVAKFVAAFIFVETGNSHYVYAATPIAMAIAFLVGWFFVIRIKQQRKIIDPQVLNFPNKFFVASALTKFSTIAFLSFDLILAKLFLPPQEAGLYALLSLTGKMVFFSGSLFSSFINPLVSREEGAERKSDKVFYKLFFASILSSLASYLAVGLWGAYTVPLLLGGNADPILYLLPIYGLAMFCFSIANSLVIYHQVRRKYLLTVVSFLIALAQIVGIALYHQDLRQIVYVMNTVGVVSLVVILFLHFAYQPLTAIARNIANLFALFSLRVDKSPALPGKLRILILNWRDTKHVWGGGAEVYLHELSKELLKKGHTVTMFCGNDGKNPNFEEVAGIKVYRRGGFYTVYVWAAVYYLLKFRGKFDLILDSENGIPFFTPLYAGIPIIGLVHHVHQEVFRAHLSFPLSQIAGFLEGKLMPFVYKNTKFITVSNSSKEAMEVLGIGKKLGISIINPGVDLSKFNASKKTENPTILYLGRLKPYKSIGRLIAAFSHVIKDIPNATLTIAGEGESRMELEDMTKNLGLTSVVKFLGRVSEKAKAELLANSWIVAQPSKIEGWGITVIEANAAGTLVIASDVPGLRDSIRNPHTGLLVTWDNQEKWVDAMVKVIKDENFRKSLEAEAQLWSKNFSWEKSAEDFLSIIEALNKMKAVISPTILIKKQNA